MSINNSTKEDYIVCCIICYSDKNLSMIAHRNKDGKLVGWVFACSDCRGKIYDKKLNIEFIDNANI